MAQQSGISVWLYRLPTVSFRTPNMSVKTTIMPYCFWQLSILSTQWITWVIGQKYLFLGIMIIFAMSWVLTKALNIFCNISSHFWFVSLRDVSFQFFVFWWLAEHFLYCSGSWGSPAKVRDFCKVLSVALKNCRDIYIYIFSKETWMV